MSREKLVYMANQIATFFESQAHAKAVNGVADHINSFWEPRMRAQLLDILAEGGDHGLKETVVGAGEHIKPPKQATHVDVCAGEVGARPRNIQR